MHGLRLALRILHPAAFQERVADSLITHLKLHFQGELLG